MTEHSVEEIAGEFEKKLREVTEVGYANGFLACIVRISEEAVLHRGCTAESIIGRLKSECNLLPGYLAEKART